MKNWNKEDLINTATTDMQDENHYNNHFWVKLFLYITLISVVDMIAFEVGCAGLSLNPIECTLRHIVVAVMFFSPVLLGAFMLGMVFRAVGVLKFRSWKAVFNKSLNWALWCSVLIMLVRIYGEYRAGIL